jgi:hypothetical protein
MTLAEFIEQTPNFHKSSSIEKIKIFAWFLHTHGEKEFFDNAAVRNCFRQTHSPSPDVSVYLPRMAAKKPPELLRERGGYRLAGSIRKSLDAKYGEGRTLLGVTNLLSSLPSKVANRPEQVFLSEAIECYRVKAFRATTVMAWNLAFDHLVSWIFTEAGRVLKFNAAIAVKFPTKRNISIKDRADFEEFKEADVIEICRIAKLLPKNVVEILREKLKRRNIAAHPSSGVVVTQAQADDTITDLVNNVVLKLQ